VLAGCFKVIKSSTVILAFLLFMLITSRSKVLENEVLSRIVRPSR